MPLHRRSVVRRARSEAPGEQLLGTKRKVGRVHLASLICHYVKASVVRPMNDCAERLRIEQHVSDA